MCHRGAGFLSHSGETIHDRNPGGEAHHAAAGRSTWPSARARSAAARTSLAAARGSAAEPARRGACGGAVDSGARRLTSNPAMPAQNGIRHGRVCGHARRRVGRTPEPCGWIGPPPGGSNHTRFPGAAAASGRCSKCSVRPRPMSDRPCTTHWAGPVVRCVDLGAATGGP